MELLIDMTGNCRLTRRPIFRAGGTIVAYKVRFSGNAATAVAREHHSTRAGSGQWIGERWCRLGLLAPAAIRRVREKTGLSAVDMGLMLGVGEKSYTRWENGRSLQTKASDTLIRLITQTRRIACVFEAEL